MIFSHCDFTQDMEQAVVHLVVDFRKPHDFFSGSALQVSEKTAVFGAVSYTHLDVYKRQIHKMSENISILTFGI